MAFVIEPFAFAADGFTVENLVKGDEREFGAITDGLVKAGLVSIDPVEDEVPKLPLKKSGK